MANNLTAFSPEIWSARVQYLLKRNLVGAAIANTEEKSGLYFGYRVHRPIPSDVYAQPYTKGTALTFQDITASDEYLTIDQSYAVPVYLDDIDKIQNKYPTMDLFATRSAYQLKSKIDQNILGSLVSAALTNGTAATASTANIFQLFSEAKAALSQNAVEESKPWYAVVDPDTASIIEQFRGVNGFMVADDTIKAGYGWAQYFGEWMGLRMYKSQNLPFFASITFSDVSVDTQTVVINGVTFTTVSPIGTTEGNVLVGASAAASATNLYNAINASVTGGASTAQYIPYSVGSASASTLARAGIVATNPSSGVVKVQAAGKMTVSKTQTNAAWGAQTKNCFVGQIGDIDLVLQKDVTTEMQRTISAGKIGTAIITSTLWGTKMFTESQQRTYKMVLNA